MKTEMINIFFYLGCTVAIVFLIALLIILFWAIFFKLLNLAKARNVIFKIILQKEIANLNDNDYMFLQRQMQKARRKYQLLKESDETLN